MPFGLLWCCYNANTASTAVKRGSVTNAFRPVVVLLRDKEMDKVLADTKESPMPFGLLWCCYLPEDARLIASAPESPMPFGLLWCCYISFRAESRE